MQITRLTEESFVSRRLDFHVLTYAEQAVLRFHTESRGLSEEFIANFASQVNRSGAPGGLHPKAPVSAVPAAFIRDIADGAALSRQIKEFLLANRRSIHAKRVLCDFRAPEVAPFVITAVETAFSSPEADGIEEVGIIR